MLKIIMAIAVTSCLSLNAYSLNIKDNLNDEALKEAVNVMLPYEREYVPYLLKEFKDFECLNVSNNLNKINCGGINKLVIKEDNNRFHVILSGYALQNNFSYIEPLFNDKNGFNIVPLDVKVISNAEGISVLDQRERKLNKGFFDVVYSFDKKKLVNLSSISFLSQSNLLRSNFSNDSIPSIISVENGLKFNVETIISNNNEQIFKIVFTDKSNDLVKEKVESKELVSVVRSLSLDNTLINNNVKNPAHLKTIITISSNSNKEFNLGNVMFPKSYLINVSTNNFLKQNGDELIASISIGKNEIILEELIGTDNFKFDIKNKIKGIDSEIWIIENTPRWSAPLGVSPISSDDSRVPPELRNKNAYLVKDTITINQTPITVSKNMNSLINKRVSYLKSKDEINNWDNYNLEIDQNSINNILSLDDKLKNNIVMNAATFNKKEIPVYTKDSVPYIKVSENGYYNFQYTSNSLNSKVMNIKSKEDNPLEWSLITNPRERLLWVNGAEFKDTELSNWNFYSIFWLVFFGFLIWKLINWKLSVVMIGSFIVLDSIFGHFLSFFWVFFLTSYLYIEMLEKNLEMKNKINVVTFLTAVSLIVIVPNGVKFIKVELESIVNPMTEMSNNLRRISLLEIFNDNNIEAMFSLDNHATQDIEISKDSVEEYRKSINNKTMKLEMAPMALSAPMLTFESNSPVPVEIARDQIYTSQVMRDRPIMNSVDTYFNRTLKATYIGNYPDSINPVVASKWIVNLVGIIQILTVLFVFYIGIIMFIAGFKDDKELLRKQFFLKNNNLKFKG